MSQRFYATPLALVLGLSAAGASAQDGGLSVSLGLKVWNAQWTTFGYEPLAPAILTQDDLGEKRVLLPSLGLRYGDFIASVSAFTNTSYRGTDGLLDKRREYDAHVGYFVLPGLALTVGYKKIEQIGSAGKYAPAGPVLGLSASALLSGPISAYGSFGIGRMKTPSGNPIKFDADYRLSELGLAYGLRLDGWPKALTFTLGYRTQMLISKEAKPGIDGRDPTLGFTLGVIAGF